MKESSVFDTEGNIGMPTYNFIEARWDRERRRISDTPPELLRHLEAHLDRFSAATPTLRIDVRCHSDRRTWFFTLHQVAVLHHSFLHIIVTDDCPQTGLDEATVRDIFCRLYGTDLERQVSERRRELVSLEPDAQIDRPYPYFASTGLIAGFFEPNAGAPASPLPLHLLMKGSPSVCFHSEKWVDPEPTPMDEGDRAEVSTPLLLAADPPPEESPSCTTFPSQDEWPAAVDTRDRLPLIAMSLLAGILLSVFALSERLRDPAAVLLQQNTRHTEERAALEARLETQQRLTLQHEFVADYLRIQAEVEVNTNHILMAELAQRAQAENQWRSQSNQEIRALRTALQHRKQELVAHQSELRDRKQELVAHQSELLDRQREIAAMQTRLKQETRAAAQGTEDPLFEVQILKPLNLRDIPTTSGNDPLRTLEEGEVFPVLRELETADGTWYALGYGWVKKTSRIARHVPPVAPPASHRLAGTGDANAAMPEEDLPQVSAPPPDTVAEKGEKKGFRFWFFGKTND